LFDPGRRPIEHPRSGRGAKPLVPIPSGRPQKAARSSWKMQGWCGRSAASHGPAFSGLSALAAPCGTSSAASAAGMTLSLSAARPIAD